IMGTAHLLDALRATPSAKVAVMVTTDKVYRNNEWPHPYRESDTLGGHDPYSASKAASELVIASYRDAFLHAQGVAIATARAGNVIGGGDWSVDRLLPDAVRAWRDNGDLHIRRPDSVRPWQHVLEPLAGYLTLAQALWDQPALAGRTPRKRPRCAPWWTWRKPPTDGAAPSTPTCSKARMKRAC
ncbi:MAG: GDP-mannose 4,6-dehydratase, partial [Achromobacter kerstersii]|uniref:GDP-mannose 4,6-dehydratase n=1 Tax=Achromobacter kerstersii TaxID=1353890 RepID=UPI003CFDD483